MTQVLRSGEPIPWSRIGTEGVAIVASILAAFAIDAWWQQWAMSTQTGALIANLESNLRDNPRRKNE